jgi:hypothetical protein
VFDGVTLKHNQAVHAAGEGLQGVAMTKSVECDTVWLGELYGWTQGEPVRFVAYTLAMLAAAALRPGTAALSENTERQACRSSFVPLTGLCCRRPPAAAAHSAERCCC